MNDNYPIWGFGETYNSFQELRNKRKLEWNSKGTHRS